MIYADGKTITKEDFETETTNFVPPVAIYRINFSCQISVNTSVYLYSLLFFMQSYIRAILICFYMLSDNFDFWEYSVDKTLYVIEQNRLPIQNLHPKISQNN